jgi:deoxyribonucleoside regulator
MEDNKYYIKVAHWYYTLGLTQDEIARRLSTTRQRVNRIIGELTELGIVTTRVNGFSGSMVASEALLEEKFGLSRVIIAESYGEEKAMPMIAECAARYLEDTIESKSTVGVSWGSTLAQVISRMSFINRANCRVVQMVGAQNMDLRSLKSDEIARALANRLDCVCQMLYSPAIVERPETKKLLMQEKAVQNTFDIMSQCDIALLGIGQLNSDATMYTRGLLSKSDVDDLRARGFIGDLCVNPVKADGSWQGCPMEDRIITADMETLKKIPNVVAVAGGGDKAEAIAACLRSGVVDTLIIDDVTAAKIIRAEGLLKDKISK